MHNEHRGTLRIVSGRKLTQQRSRPRADLTQREARLLRSSAAPSTKGPLGETPRAKLKLQSPKIAHWLLNSAYLFHTCVYQ